MSVVEWNGMKVVQLRGECRSAGLSAQGRKAELIARLQQHQSSSSSNDSGSSSSSSSGSSSNSSSSDSAENQEEPIRRTSSLQFWFFLSGIIALIAVMLGTKQQTHSEKNKQILTPALYANMILSVLSAIAVYWLIPVFQPLFLKAGLFGIDMSKVGKQKVAESAGIIVGGVYLIFMFLFIPFPFANWYMNVCDDAADAEGAASAGDVTGSSTVITSEATPAITFPHNKYSEFIAALLSICCMLFLGFVDDVLDLRWRHKLLLPTFATLPLLMVYFVNIGTTAMLVPIQLVPYFGTYVDIGALYYVYMGMVAVFCTNAVNILAGVNGLEVGQSLVIGLSIVWHNIVQLHGTCCSENNLFSLYMMLPFVGVSVGLMYHNWYPSYVFVGDTYCYFAGMAFAVVGILGHFSKTMMLFFVPQTINFLYSVPQLFKFLPCPRHRLPRFDRETGLMNMSMAEFEYSELFFLGRLSLGILQTLRVVYVEREGDTVRMNNLTIINFALKVCGPMREDRLTMVLLGVQVACSCLAFVVRYELAKLVYTVVT